MPFKDKQYSFVSTPIIDALPIAAQTRGTTLHVRLADGKYVSVKLRVPGDAAGKLALFDAIKAQPTEPSYSGTGRLYFTLAVGHAIRGKLEGLSLVPLHAGEDGPLAGYVMVDQGLIQDAATEAAYTPPPVPTDPAMDTATDTEGDDEDGDDSEDDEEGEKE